MTQNRKELVQKFIAKLKDEIQELRDYYNGLLEGVEYAEYAKDEQFYWLNLIKLDVVETAFCDDEFYNEKYSNDNYIISNELLTMLCVRELSTAQDLMDSVYLSTRFTNKKEFEFNLLTVFERMILSDKFKEN